MSTELWLDFLGIRLNGSKADGKHYVINFVTPDRGQTFVLELSNATLTSIEGHVADDADLTVTVDRDDLDEVMTSERTFNDLVSEGKATLEGNAAVLGQLMSMMVRFTPDFEMLPGTARN